MDMDAIDPEIRHFVLEMRKAWTNYPPLETMSFPEQRAAAEEVRAPWRKGGPRMKQTQEFTFDPGAGDLRIRIHHPNLSNDAKPAFIYLHGGGFTLFSTDTHDRLMREYAKSADVTVIGVDYPLAPEAKYPIALNRIEALMLWMTDNAYKWGIDPNRIAMGGDSAGANLAFATCLRLRNHNKLSSIRAILSNYGGFSSKISDDAETRFGGPGSIMDRAEALQYWNNYLRDDTDEKDPYACPLLADLTGFPPVLLVVAELDIVAEHSQAMHERLRDFGVDSNCVVYKRTVHSFLEAMSISTLAQTAIEESADFIANHLKRHEN